MSKQDSNDSDKTTSLTLDEAILLLRMYVHEYDAPSDERALAHMALDRVIAVCAEHGLEPS